MPPAPSFLRTLCAWFLNGCAFSAAFVAACAAIGWRLPAPRAFEIAQKLDYIAAHPEIDTVFVGSSRIFHSFDPVQFDRELATRGVQARSFNLGIDGMRPPESLYVARQLIALRPGIKRVLIELWDINPKIAAQNIATVRTFHWHDWRHTLMVLRHIFASPISWDEKRRLASLHITCFAGRMSNAGRGPELLAARLRPSKKATQPLPPWEGREGFVPDSSKSLTGAERTQYEASVAFVKATPPPPLPLSPLMREALSDLVGEIDRRGAVPVFIIPPSVNGRENIAPPRSQGIDAALLAFNDANRFPELFETDRHCDVQHLNARGAADFSRRLAESFAAEQ